MKNYKICVIFLVLIFGKYSSAIPDEMKIKLSNAVQVCASETGVEADKINEFLHGERQTASHELKCFVNCFANKMGYIANGEPQIEEMRKSFEKLPNFDSIKFDKANEACKSEYSGADECEKAFKYMNCRRDIAES